MKYDGAHQHQVDSLQMACKQKTDEMNAVLSSNQAPTFVTDELSISDTGDDKIRDFLMKAGRNRVSADSGNIELFVHAAHQVKLDALRKQAAQRKIQKERQEDPAYRLQLYCQEEWRKWELVKDTRPWDLKKLWDLKKQIEQKCFNMGTVENGHSSFELENFQRRLE